MTITKKNLLINYYFFVYLYPHVFKILITFNINYKAMRISNLNEFINMLLTIKNIYL